MFIFTCIKLRADDVIKQIKDDIFSGHTKNSKMKTKMLKLKSFYINRRAYYNAKHRRLIM